MDSARVAFWQDAWRTAQLGRAVRSADREKFYALVAYPGTSGFLHVGHLRGLIYADVLHRFRRMQGAAVFFPFGVHASGLPAVTFAQRVKERHESTVRALEHHGVPPGEWPKLEDPEYAARFLGRHYLDALRRVGLLLDESAFLTTVDDDYRAFIRWQFHRLEARGALVQKSHYSAVCPVCGPVAVDPSETDLSRGGTAEVVQYTTIPFRLPDGRILLAATLRPETIYGVTNLWIPQGEALVSWTNGPATYLVSRSGAARLLEQHGGRIGHEIRAQEFQGRSATAALTGVPVPIFPSPLVDPHVGTGVVMSVPAHAPADALALKELTPAQRESIRPPPVILAVPPSAELPASEQALVQGKGTPAERAAQATGATSLSDRATLDQATERLYRLEHARGTMTVRDYLGVPVADARAKVAERLERTGQSFELREFSEPVICRNGHPVVIRRVPRQWFLRYSDPEWKALSRTAIASMQVQPEEYARELPAVLDWMDDRPCTRQGRWLGTPFPLDAEWVIEPIADSTLYPAYYIVRRFVADRGLLPSSLTDPFFDFVLLGEGEGEPAVDRALQEEVREEVRYWYPLDWNIGGKEHKRVHFPPFVMNHALLLPPEFAPRGIFVHGWVTTASGEKLSKKDVGSKGGPIPPLLDALERWGADALRLVIATAALPALDMEWDAGSADAAQRRLEEIERLAKENLAAGEGAPELDGWLLSEMHQIVRRVTDAYRTARFREAAEAIYVHVPALLKRYAARDGVAGDATAKAVRAWVRLMAPITPHLAEELGAEAGSDLVAVRRFPTPEEFPRSERSELSEAFLTTVEEDLRNVLRPLVERGEPTPEEAVFYVASPWKRSVEAWVREACEGGAALDLGKIMARAETHPEVALHRGEVAKYAQRIAAAVHTEPGPPAIAIDELDVLRAAAAYLARRFHFESVSVHAEAEAESVDPMHRRERARPGRPAFYLVRRRDAGPTA